LDERIRDEHAQDDPAVGGLDPSPEAADKLLAGHPNAHVYHALGAILELEGHYLEAEPLHATVQPE